MSLKAKLLAGIKYTETVVVNEIKIKVRGMSSEESSMIEADGLNTLVEIEETEPDIMKKTDDKNISAKLALLLNKNEHERKWKIAAMCIVDDEPWTIDEVKKLDEFTIDAIVDKAMTLSKKGEREDLISFPGISAGTGDTGNIR